MSGWDTTDLEIVIVELSEINGTAFARVVALVANEGLQPIGRKSSADLMVQALEAANPEAVYITDDSIEEPWTQEKILDLLRQRRAQRAKAHRYG